ncbi:pyridoxamine 5'-phosphate oxidase family protein [Bacteroidota bacterium]
MKRRNNLSILEINNILFFLIFLCIITLPPNICAQEEQSYSPEQDTLLTIARLIMDDVRFCALVTLDQSGRPQVRTMDPFPPEDNMVVWLGTTLQSRKVEEIRNDSRVSLYYQYPDGSGYVVILGNAFLVTKTEEKESYWKEGWESYFPDTDEDYILIKVVPERLEILSYKHGIIGDSVTWRTPSVEFKELEK